MQVGRDLAHRGCRGKDVRWHSRAAGASVEPAKRGRMDVERIGLAVFGAFVGALGWLVVGMFLQRRDAERRARSAARAVWFEIGINAVGIELARDHGVFTALSRSSFDRLLPDLATWLPLDELEVIAGAYQGHAGYEQAWRDTSLPEAVRRALLSRLAEATRDAHDRLAGRAFANDARPTGTAAATDRATTR